MAIEWTDDFREYDNAQLGTAYDFVSPNISDGSIVQDVAAGRDGAGGVTFTPCTDANGFNYPLYLQKTLTAQARRTVQVYVVQAAAQGTLGGRLLTFVDASENVFGATVQVALNIMDDNTLQATRSSAASTGIILRGVDQGGDSQMTLLGTSSGALDGTDYLEIEVVHDAVNGEINVWKDGDVFWALTGVNTAISGNNQSTDVLLGGYAVTGNGDDVLHHEDLNVTVSDLMKINGSTNPHDPNDPTQRIGDHKPLLSLPTADANYTQYTPDPAGSHFANVNEIPPDEGTTENSASETALRDNFEMQDVAGTGTNPVYLTYKGFVKADTPAECGVSAQPANFEAFVYTEQPSAGSVQSTLIGTTPCNVGILGMGHRAQSVCTISQDGEAVTFTTPTVSQSDRFYAFLTPLNAPPRLQVKVQNVAGVFGPTVFNTWQNMIPPVTSEVRYALPWYQPWAGYAVDTQHHLSTSGDYFEFDISGEGASLDVGLIDHNYSLVADPYSPVLAAIHFREDIIGTPFYFIGTNFTYDGEPTHTYSDGDTFRFTRSGGDIQVRQNGSLIETITPGVMPADLLPYVFAGRWGFRSGSYSVRPVIKNGVAATDGIACTVSNYGYSCTVTGVGPAGQNTDMEVSQWGIVFESFVDGAFGTVVDPGNSTVGPQPQFQYDASTVMKFRLSGGNVLLEVTNYLFIEGFVESGGTGTYTYSRPYADTDDFFLQPPFDTDPVGVLPQFGGPDSFEFEFVPAAANAPLRLGFIVNIDEPSDPDRPQLNNVSFTFIEGQNPTTFTGFMRQSASDRSGTTTTAPVGNFAYRESHLASTPADMLITLDDANASQHGYTDPSE